VEEKIRCGLLVFGFKHAADLSSSSIIIFLLLFSYDSSSLTHIPIAQVLYTIIDALDPLYNLKS
jgi:hypothetical protein